MITFIVLQRLDIPTRIPKVLDSILLNSTSNNFALAGDVFSAFSVLAMWPAILQLSTRQRLSNYMRLVILLTGQTRSVNE